VRKAVRGGRRAAVGGGIKVEEVKVA